MSRFAWALVLLALFTFFFGLGAGPITDSDEGFYAEAAREMVERGDWLTPTFNYEPRFQKPVLYYWLTAATYLLTGPTEFAARLWSAAAGLGLVLVTAACARRWFDDATGTLAGAIVATNFGYVALARSALPDLPLTFCITVTTFAAVMATLERTRAPHGWLLTAAAAGGLGVLMKGPVALLIPGLVLVPLLLIERRSLPLRPRNLVSAAVLFTLIAAPWYAAMAATHGSSYLEGFFVGDNLERFTTDRFNEPRAWWFYLPVLLGGLLPWTPLAIVWVAPIRDFVLGRRAMATLEVRLLFWAVMPLLFYSISVGKQPRYILPVLPPLAILLAASIVERSRTWRSYDGGFRRPRASVALRIGGVGSALALAGMALALARMELSASRAELGLPASWTPTLLPAAGVAASALALFGCSVSRFWRGIPAAVTLSGAVSLIAWHWTVATLPGGAAVREMAAYVAQARRGAEPVTNYEVFVRNLGFYTRIQHAALHSDEQLRAYLAQPARMLAVVPAPVLARVAPPSQPVTLAEVNYLDLGALRLGVLLRGDPLPTERVLLVANR